LAEIQRFNRELFAFGRGKIDEFLCGQKNIRVPFGCFGRGTPRERDFTSGHLIPFSINFRPSDEGGIDIDPDGTG